MRNLENRSSGTVHSIAADQHEGHACKDGARTLCGQQVGEDKMEWTSSEPTCSRCARRAQQLSPTEAPDTSVVLRTVVGPVVEANGAKFRVTEHRHEPARLGLRTVEVEWVTDADKHNGSHPAGTVVTRVLRGHMGRSSGVLYSETVR